MTEQTKKQTIQVFLENNDPTGIKFAHAPNEPLAVTAFPRELFHHDFIQKRLQVPGGVILLSDAESDHPRAFLSYSSNVVSAIEKKNHINWDEAIIFAGKESQITEEFAKDLLYVMQTRMKSNGNRFKIDSPLATNYLPNLTDDAKKDELYHYFDMLYRLITTLGYPILVPKALDNMNLELALAYNPENTLMRHENHLVEEEPIVIPDEVIQEAYSQDQEERELAAKRAKEEETNRLAGAIGDKEELRSEPVRRVVRTFPLETLPEVLRDEALTEMATLDLMRLEGTILWFHLNDEQNTVFAKAEISKDGLAILTGAKSSLRNNNRSTSNLIRAMRTYLLDQNVIKYEEGDLIFNQRCIFPSPTLAASFLLGKRVNGLTAWKTLSEKELQTFTFDLN